MKTPGWKALVAVSLGATILVVIWDRQSRPMASSGADRSTPIARRARDRRGTVAAPTLTPQTHGHKHARPTQGWSTRATEMPTPAQSPIFTKFGQWTEEYLSEADGEARQALEARGEGLA